MNLRSLKSSMELIERTKRGKCFLRLSARKRSLKFEGKKKNKSSEHKEREKKYMKNRRMKKRR